MKNIYKTLAIVLFSLTTTLNAQLKNVDGTTNDEYLGKQPVTGGECNCVNSDIPNFNFSFSSDFLNAIANDRAVIEAAERNARDWYNHQTDLMKDYIGYKNNKTFNNYEEARNYLFRKTENDYIRKNIPSAKQKIASSYYSANNAEKVGLKELKALSYRENEINRGDLDNSLYADFKVNGTPLKDIRTISELNKIRATVNTSTVEGLWQSDQYYSMLNEINTMISSSTYSKLETSAFNKKNSLYNGYNYWDKLNMMQLQIYFQEHTQYVSYPHFLPGGVFENFNSSIEIAIPNFIENEIEKSYTEYDLFHPDYWKIILRDRFNNIGLYTQVAKDAHQSLMNAELNRLKRQTPMGASLNVDNFAAQFNITDKYQYEWLNANPEKADEFLERLRDAKALDAQENSQPIPDDEIISIVGENYYTEKTEIKNELAEGARIAKLAEELSLNPDQKDWMLTHFEQAIEIVNFADGIKINNEIPNTDKYFIISFLEPLSDEIIKIEDINFEDRIINSLSGRAKCVYDKLKSLSLFASTIKQFDNNNRYNLTIQNGSCLTGQDACTDASDLANGNIKIKVQGLGNSNLDFAATILHEGIHAEIFKYVDEYQQGLDPNQRENLLFWYKHYKSNNDPTFATSEAQHQHMADRFVKPIAKAIRALDNYSYPLEYYMGFGWDGLRKYGYDGYYDNGNYVNLDKNTSSSYYINQKTVNDNSSFNNINCQ